MPEQRKVGKLERLSYERIERDHELARQGHPKGYYFDAPAGDFVVNWIEKYCRHHKGKWRGQRLILAEWQRWKFRNQFGWKRPDGTRRFRKTWEEVPKKNGKTETAAATGVFLLVGDNEPGAEVYTTATAKEQAEICHNAAREMVIQSKELNQFVRVPKKKGGNLVCEALGSKMQILSSDFGTQDGLSPHGDIRDEVHAWRDHELAGVLSTAMGARSQPMTVEVTTAGVYDPHSVGWQHHDYAVSILEDKDFDDDRQFVFITGADDGDDPFDPATWWKANPNFGVSLYPDFIADQANEAKRSATAYSAFQQYHLNSWTNVVAKWLDMDCWRACPKDALDLEALRGVVAVGGLDLSATSDLTAFVLLFQLPNGDIAVLPTFWLPQGKIDEELRKKGQVRLKNWLDLGFLKATPGVVVDYDFIRKDINEQAKRFKIKQVGTDPWNATHLITQLQSDGINVVEVRQGPPSLTAACKELERLTIQKKLRFQGHPVLTWCAGNAVVRKDSNGNIAPDKERAKDKIDGVSATVNALSLMVSAKPTGGGSLLERRGLVVLG